jgi:hypothetical protein
MALEEAGMLRALTLISLLAAGCAAPVAFDCVGDAPLCAINALLDDPRPLAPGIRVARVAAYQSVEIELMADNAEGSLELPAVAGKDTMVRVFVEPLPNFQEREIAARVWIYRDGEVVGAGEAAMTPSGASVQNNLATTINIDLPGAMLPPGELTWSVELVERAADIAVPGLAIGFYPPREPARFTAHDVGPAMRVYLVPIEWNADNSGRTTNIDDDALAYYRASLLEIFPVGEIEIEVGEPWPWDKTVESMPLWSELLSEMVMVRRTRNVPGDAYVYGVFDPGGSGTGGVAGLSMLAGMPDHEVGRSSIGISRGAGDGGGTMAHELGHAAGRPHSPCGGAGGPDPDYPHPEARLGTWGFDGGRGMLIDPMEFHDFMSYCGPTWVSDYNWNILFERQRGIHEYYRPDSVARARQTGWRTLWLHADGSVQHGEVVWLSSEPRGETREVTFVEDGREVTVQGVVLPFSHVDGGVLHVPTTAALPQVRLDGGPVVHPRFR